MGGLIDMEQRGCELIGNHNDFVTFLTSSMILTLDFKGHILKELYFRNGMVD